MGLDLEYIKGQTPVDEDEKAGLKIKTISTRGELNEFEQANIEQAVEWSLRNRFSIEQILSVDFLKEVHHRMFSEDEIAIRCKHRLVKIHLFPNGNGRHSRLCADILISHAFDKNVFSWGSENITDQGETRTNYLQAIYKADEGYLDPLIEFARS